MSIIELEDIERIVEIKKGGQIIFVLQVYDPSAGVLLAANEVQVRQNENQKALTSMTEKISNEQDEKIKEELSLEYARLEKNGMEISFDFIKCMVRNYKDIENDLKYMNINYLGQLVQAVQEEFSKTKDSKKKLVALSKKNSGESNSEKLAM